MAIVVEETISTTSGNATNLSINTGDFTPNPSVGDLLVSQFFFNATGATITLPSGWTEIEKTENAGDSLTSQLAYKVADSSDATGQSLNWSKGAGNDVIKLFVTRITGNRVANFITDSSGQGNDATTTVTAPTVTPEVANSLIMFFTACQDDSTGSISGYTLATSSPSFTEQYDATVNGFLVSMAYGIRPEITATGNGTATDTTSGVNIGQLLVISAPQVDTLTDTVTSTDALVQNMSSLIVDTVTSTDTVTDEATRHFNQAKNSATWTNQDKTQP